MINYSHEPLIGQCPHCFQSLTADHVCLGKLFEDIKTDFTFAQFRTTNVQRRLRWHEGAGRPWVGPDWGNETAGEVGEMCNIIKKIQRHYDGIQQAGFDYAAAMENLKKEIGDVVICAELVSEFFNLRLEDCVRYAFNKTSEKNGFPERL